MLSVKNILHNLSLSPVAKLEEQRRKAAEEITLARNTGTPADVVTAIQNHSQIQDKYDEASGLKPTL